MSKGSHGHKCKRSAYPWINAKNNRRIYLNKFIVAAAFTVGALVAMPAGAADLHVVNSSASVVRIILTNKSPDQLNKEIEAAANLVCADVNAGNDCVSEVIFDAKKQVTALTGKTLGKIEVARNDPTSIRVILKGKSVAQINQEIETAAATVCKNASVAEYRNCVAEAVSDAKGRLAEAQKAGALG